MTIDKHSSQATGENRWAFPGPLAWLDHGFSGCFVLDQKWKRWGYGTGKRCAISVGTWLGWDGCIFLWFLATLVAFSARFTSPAANNYSPSPRRTPPASNPGFLLRTSFLPPSEPSSGVITTSSTIALAAAYTCPSKTASAIILPTVVSYARVADPRAGKAKDPDKLRAITSPEHKSTPPSHQGVHVLQYKQHKQPTCLSIVFSSPRPQRERSVSNPSRSPSDRVSVHSADQISIRSSPGSSLYRSNSGGYPSSAAANSGTPSGQTAASIYKEGAGAEFYAGTYFPTIHENEEEELRAGAEAARRRRFQYPESDEEDETSWYYRRSASLNLDSSGELSKSAGSAKMPSSIASSGSHQQPSTPALDRRRSFRGGSISVGQDASNFKTIRGPPADLSNYTPARPGSSAGMSSAASSVYSRSGTPDMYGGRMSPAMSASPSDRGDWDGTIKSRKEGQRSASKRLAKPRYGSNYTSPYSQAELAKIVMTPEGNIPIEQYIAYKPQLNKDGSPVPYTPPSQYQPGGSSNASNMAPSKLFEGIRRPKSFMGLNRDKDKDGKSSKDKDGKERNPTPPATATSNSSSGITRFSSQGQSTAQTTPASSIMHHKSRSVSNIETLPTIARPTPHHSITTGNNASYTDLSHSQSGRYSPAGSSAHSIHSIDQEGTKDDKIKRGKSKREKLRKFFRRSDGSASMMIDGGHSANVSAENLASSGEVIFSSKNSTGSRDIEIRSRRSSESLNSNGGTSRPKLLPREERSALFLKTSREDMGRSNSRMGYYPARGLADLDSEDDEIPSPEQKSPAMSEEPSPDVQKPSPHQASAPDQALTPQQPSALEKLFAPEQPVAPAPGNLPAPEPPLPAEKLLTPETLPASEERSTSENQIATEPSLSEPSVSENPDATEIPIKAEKSIPQQKPSTPEPKTPVEKPASIEQPRAVAPAQSIFSPKKSLVFNERPLVAPPLNLAISASPKGKGKSSGALNGLETGISMIPKPTMRSNMTPTTSGPVTPTKQRPMSPSAIPGIATQLPRLRHIPKTGSLSRKFGSVISNANTPAPSTPPKKPRKASIVSLADERANKDATRKSAITRPRSNSLPTLADPEEFLSMGPEVKRAAFQRRLSGSRPPWKEVIKPTEITPLEVEMEKARHRHRLKKEQQAREEAAALLAAQATAASNTSLNRKGSVVKAEIEKWEKKRQEERGLGDKRKSFDSAVSNASSGWTTDEDQYEAAQKNSPAKGSEAVVRLTGGTQSECAQLDRMEDVAQEVGSAVEEAEAEVSKAVGETESLTSSFVEVTADPEPISEPQSVVSTPERKKSLAEPLSAVSTPIQPIADLSIVATTPEKPSPISAPQSAPSTPEKKSPVLEPQPVVSTPERCLSPISEAESIFSTPEKPAPTLVIPSAPSTPERKTSLSEHRSFVLSPIAEARSIASTPEKPAPISAILSAPSTPEMETSASEPQSVVSTPNRILFPVSEAQSIVFAPEKPAPISVHQSTPSTPEKKTPASEPPSIVSTPERSLSPISETRSIVSTPEKNEPITAPHSNRTTPERERKSAVEVESLDSYLEKVEDDILTEYLVPRLTPSQTSSLIVNKAVGGGRATQQRLLDESLIFDAAKVAGSALIGSLSESFYEQPQAPVIPPPVIPPTPTYKLERSRIFEVASNEPYEEEDVDVDEEVHEIPESNEADDQWAGKETHPDPTSGTPNELLSTPPPTPPPQHVLPLYASVETIMAGGGAPGLTEEFRNELLAWLNSNLDRLTEERMNKLLTDGNMASGEEKAESRDKETKEVFKGGDELEGASSQDQQTGFTDPSSSVLGLAISAPEASKIEPPVVSTTPTATGEVETTPATTVVKEIEIRYITSHVTVADRFFWLKVTIALLVAVFFLLRIYVRLIDKHVYVCGFEPTYKSICTPELLGGKCLHIFWPRLEC
ncbi:hypothetical protein DFH27DRAFT_528157 [Peziza echinospora]|nr:hypothetical protein DFH27DRAFT_528157 [Peziza echinospora]